MSSRAGELAGGALPRPQPAEARPGNALCLWVTQGARGKQPGPRVATDKGGGRALRVHSRQRSLPEPCCPSPAGASDTGGRVRGESSPATGCRQEGCGETAAGQMRSARWGAERRGAAGSQVPKCWVSSLLRAQSTRSRWLHRAPFWVRNRSRKVSWARANYCSVFTYSFKKKKSRCLCRM